MAARLYAALVSAGRHRHDRTAKLEFDHLDHVPRAEYGSILANNRRLHLPMTTAGHRPHNADGAHTTGNPNERGFKHSVYAQEAMHHIEPP